MYKSGVQRLIGRHGAHYVKTNVYQMFLYNVNAAMEDIVATYFQPGNRKRQYLRATDVDVAISNFLERGGNPVMALTRPDLQNVYELSVATYRDGYGRETQYQRIVAFTPAYMEQAEQMRDDFVRQGYECRISLIKR